MRETELKIEEIPISELVPYENNAKKHTREQIGAVEASIREFGFRAPCIVWRNADGRPEVVAGHARITAARNVGMEKVPCVSCDDLTDAQRRALTLVDNQTTMMTGWDEDILAYELDVLCGEFDMADFGFDEEIIGTADCADGIEDEELPETVECRCKRGDVWVLGSHRVVCGSATDPADMDRLTGGGFCDLLLTDPPYNIAYEGKTVDAMTIENDSWADDCEFVAFLESAFSNAVGAMRPGAAFYIWHADTRRASFLEACSRAGMDVRECLVWAKNTLTLGRQDYQWRHEPCLYGWKGGAAHRWYSDRSQSTVLEFDKPSSNSEHPTMKPVPLMAYLVKNSTKRGDVVLDVFGGSGSTLLACEKLGRTCWTMELDPRYCDVILARWEQMTGLEAERAS